MTPAVPVQHDDLSRYVPGMSAAPVVWVRVAATDDARELVAKALRDPAHPSCDPCNPYPVPMASPEELQRWLVPRQIAALATRYRDWVAALGPWTLDDLTDEWVRDLVDFATRQGAARVLERIRHGHAVALHAAYGRPALALSELDVLRWAVLAGVLPVPRRPGAGAYEPEGRVVGRLTAYAMQAQRASHGH